MYTFSQSRKEGRLYPKKLSNTAAAITDNDDDNDDDDNDDNGGDEQHPIVFEPGYPKRSRTHYFPTYASEKEMAKHDRYIIHGMIYMEMLTKEYLEKHWNLISKDMKKDSSTTITTTTTTKTTTTKKICMNILFKGSRTHPYISALMMSLMGSHEEEEEREDGSAAGDDLLSYVELHLLDTEVNVHTTATTSNHLEYDRQREKVVSLPFVNVHYRKQSTSTTTSTTTTVKNIQLHQIENYIQAAEQCIQSNLDYCLILQEYTIVPIDFIPSLQSIITTLESNAEFMTNSTSTTSPTTMMMMSLFSSYDHSTKSIIQIHNVKYSRELYEVHRGKLNSERKSLGLDEHTSEYTIHLEDSGVFKGGYNVAMLFPTHGVKESLLPFLMEMKKIREGENQSVSDDKSCNFDLEKEYIRYTGYKKYVVEPSLVNRIGFYDDDFINGFDAGVNEKYFDDERLGITNWLTDTRFLFEAGEYWEGREMFCQNEDGEWVEDEFYFDDGDKSTCKGDVKEE